MSKKIQVRVVQKHIDEGKKDDPFCCPIALALREMGYRDVAVGPDTIDIGDEQYDTPAVARAFIECFDEWGTGLPIQFELEEIEIEYDPPGWEGGFAENH